MIARAHQAIGRLVMEGGLPKDVIDMLAKANTRLVETQHGPAGEAAGEQQVTDPNADTDASKPPFPSKEDEEEPAVGASKTPLPGGKPSPLNPPPMPAKKPFPPK